MQKVEKREKWWKIMNFSLHIPATSRIIIYFLETLKFCKR